MIKKLIAVEMETGLTITIYFYSKYNFVFGKRSYK